MAPAEGNQFKVLENFLDFKDFACVQPRIDFVLQLETILSQESEDAAKLEALRS